MLVFDLDDTLYLRSEPYLRAFHKLFPEYDTDEAQLIRRARYYDADSFDRYSKGLITIERMYIERVRDTFNEFGISVSDEKAAEFQKQYSENMKSIILQPEFKKLLDWCRARNIRMGILTNGPSKRQRVKIQALGLYDYVKEEDVLASEDIGINKPDIRIFRTYEEKTGTKPDGLWMIGDSYKSDIAGSLQAGWHAAWIRRDFLDNPDPDTYIPEISEDDEKRLVQKLQSLYK